MTCNNADLVYNHLSDEYAPNLRKLDTQGGMHELAHAWSQRGEPLRQYKVEHAPPVMTFEQMWNYVCGRKMRMDSKVLVSYGRAAQASSTKKSLLHQQRKNPWQTHQSVAMKEHGQCSYKCCPGWRSTTVKRKQPFRTRMKCEECSADQSKPVFL